VSQDYQYENPRNSSVFNIKILGKGIFENKTYLFLLIEGSDNVNNAWYLRKNMRLGSFTDASGVRYPLTSKEVSHSINAGTISIVMVRVGSEGVYDSINLIEKGQLYISEDDVRPRSQHRG